MRGSIFEYCSVPVRFTNRLYHVLAWQSLKINWTDHYCIDSLENVELKRFDIFWTVENTRILLTVCINFLFASGSSVIFWRSVLSRRLASSSWISTPTSFRCTTWSRWRRSPTLTWTSTSGTRETKGSFSRHGSNRQTQNHPHFSPTSGARESITYR